MKVPTDLLTEDMVEYYNEETTRSFLFGMLPKDLREGTIVDVVPHYIDDVVDATIQKEEPV